MIPRPGLEHVARVRVLLDPPIEVGATPFGRLREIPIAGGTVSGPLLRGEVLPGGADRQQVLDDGTAVVDTRYLLRLDSGYTVALATHGFRGGPPEVLAALAAGEPVAPDAYRFRVVVSARTADPDRLWLNSSVIVAAAVREPDAVEYDAYLVT